MNPIKIRNEERMGSRKIRILGSPDGDLGPGAR